MNMPEISAIFKEILTNQSTLLRGREYLDGLMQNKPNFLLETCKLFILSNETVKFRKNVGILLNIMIQDHWDDKDIKFNYQKQKKVKKLY